MQSVLDEINSQLVNLAARELDRRLIWDIVCAYCNGISLHDVAIGCLPNGDIQLIRKTNIGEMPEIIGPKHRILSTVQEDSITLNVS